MLMTNCRAQKQNQYMFNDTILALYVILCLHYVVNNKPLLASLMLTLAVSIKAGGLLLIPSILGWI